MLHPIQLIPGSNLTISFNLKLVGNANPILHPFFETVNPGDHFADPLIQGFILNMIAFSI